MKPRRTKKRILGEVLKGFNKPIGKALKKIDTNIVGSWKNKTVTCGNMKNRNCTNSMI